jgi:nucleoporin GLE1
LDQAAAERARVHAEQLKQAAQEHQKVQDAAKFEIQRLREEKELQEQRELDATRKEVERLRQENLRKKAEAEQREIEASRREAEAARKSAEHQKQIQEAEEARVKAQKEQEEALRRNKEAAEKQAREVAVAAQQARSQQPPPAPATVATPAPPTAKPAGPAASTSTPAPGVEEIHAKYLALHAQMKKFRTEFAKKHSAKGDPLKGPVGDIRRALRTRLGQVTKARSDTKAVITRLRQECFDKALQTPGPMIDVREYIVSHHIPQLANQAEAQYPALLFYAWICFEKSIIQQWNQEAASEDHSIIQELGILAASLYQDKKYQWKGTVPMTDTLFAKLHRVCPMMFGISGNTTTKQGLARLGLDKYGGSDNNLNAYLQMATGVGAGFASVCLRQFNTVPAVPMAEYWRAVASICNTPSDALYPGHLMCLRGLLRDFIKQFLFHYGAPAKAVVRRATRTLPARAPAERPGMKDAAGIVRALPDKWKRDLQIDIDR